MSLTDEQISKCAEPIYGYSLDPEDTQDRQFARAIESAATAPLLEQIKELERQLEQTLRDAEWRPIETAPKDVTVLLYGAKRLEMCVGMHHSRDGWVTDTTSEWATMYPPTHWMPLPAPPAIDAAIKESK
jgi:hypothetical protein